MSINDRATSVSRSIPGQVTCPASSETRQLLNLGHHRGWDCALLGQTPVPVPCAPVRVRDWLIAPVEVDTSPIPARTLARVQAIHAAGLRPQAFLVVHEAPRLLTPPGGDRTQSGKTLVLSPRVRSALKLAGSVLGTLATGLAVVAGLAVLAAAVLVLAGFLIVPVLMVMGAVAVDPILVAVTEDGYWVEIDRWSS